MESMPLSVRAVVLFGLVAISSLYYAVSKYISYARLRRMAAAAGCEPPRTIPNKYPFGIDLLMDSIKYIKQRKFREYLVERARKYGPTYRVNMLNLSALVSADPEIAKTVFASKAEDYAVDAMRVKAFTDFLGPGIFSVDGSAWQHSRALVRPSFTRANVEDTQTLEDHFQRLLASTPPDGTSFDLQKLFFRFTIDFSTDILFGAPPSADGQSRDRFIEAFDYCTKYCTKRLTLGSIATIIPDGRYNQSKRIVREFVDKYVRQMLEKPSSTSDRYCFLRELVKETRDQTVLRSELCNILLAARDTTASLLGNLWHVLARRPDVVLKLRQEIDTLNGRTPSWSELKSMRYLQDTINESLRVHTVVPANSRMTIRPTILPRGGGPSGTSPILLDTSSPVLLDFYTMNKRHDIWGPDADEFKPERWRRKELSQPLGWNFAPFSGGARICLGQQMAMIEASYVTARLLQVFGRIEARDPRPWAEEFNMIMPSGNGTVVAVWRR